ncbi:phenylalanyl-tRNA synthetase beta chain [Novimethylophilus kurashikiensis]|uniref:Phenylalanine--tRNA ligase beta subunit n=1 Tax=Novimethylophilus kurashikiensis TaxID=1825523 RepID=A0A2R5FAV5_9PROT|nr:phenylalanine--tRNA ligase subunit beta [Novimethylophilus kurashikiensis]GBG14033.1 phenylalanyl-tRNA synthetase beta chain [Novimethylophilus kurashikiensis]
MKFSENWLRSYVDPKLSSDELNHLLTMAGLEVESQEPVAPVFNKVVIAHILSAEKHPDADRLQVLRVDVGQGEPLQIVCGGANARVGLKSACALVGASLPGFEIKRAKVRGVESFGMMCSEKELGLAAESAGIIELPEDAPVGQDVREYFDLNDQVFELKLTPNRSDCLSLAGIARDVSALTSAPLKMPQVGEVSVTTQQTGNVRVDAQVACPRYCGRVITGVNAQAETPLWMRRQLERSGLRGISAVVDITNYVLLEMGQPLHAFDLAKLTGDIQVRMAKQGESLTLLNDQVAELHDDMLVIADGSGPIALAGIMGGSSTAVSDATTNIFLESAYFAPAAIAGRARRLGLSTDSSYRFERGVDFAATRTCLERATQLILEICGGQAGPVTEVAAALPIRQPVSLRLSKAVDVLGIPLTQEKVADLLTRLQFQFTQDGDVFTVTPPSYRFDIVIEEDLIEEIVRLHGYEHLPALPPKNDALVMLPSDESKRGLARLRQLLVDADYREAITYSFVDAAWERDLMGNVAAIPLRNPIASNMSVMRSSLWGGLLDALQYNLNRTQARVRLFEVGACFYQEGTSYREITHIGGLCYGDAYPEQWGETERSVDFFDVKTDVEALVGAGAVFKPAQHPALHPGQTAQVWLNGRAIGWIGTLHPRWQQHYDFPRGVVLFELELDALNSKAVPKYAEISKFPTTRRDLAVVVDENIPVQDMLDAMRAASETLVNDVAVFDIYRGKGIAEGQKSVAFLVLMQDTQKTLTDEDADAAMVKLIAVLTNNFGAALRS